MHGTFTRAKSGAFNTDLLVALCDWTLFASYARSHNSADVFSTLDEFYLLAETVVEDAGGLVVKFMGDAALVIFPEDLADTGVMALLELKQATDRWFEGRGMPNRLHIGAHFGEATLGPMGRKRLLDVIGDTVNITATLGSKTFALTPQAFRRLTPEHRRVFHRFTPPALYLADAPTHLD